MTLDAMTSPLKHKGPAIVVTRGGRDFGSAEEVEFGVEK